MNQVANSQNQSVNVTSGGAASTPLERYALLLEHAGFQRDSAQAEVVQRLDALFKALSAYELGRSGLSARIRQLLGRSVQPPKGLYLWGGVGRGKTMLMDLFYECLPPGQRLRMHFHRFMQRVHHQLRDLKGTPNPLEAVAEDMARESSVICFDEFFVSDIGDAMILGELLRILFARGVTLVATSNVVPDRLYENGLQRRRFLPAIELLKNHMDVHHVDGPTDFRLRVLERAEIYHYPLDAAATEGLARSFAELSVEVPVENVPLEVEGRIIRVRRMAEDIGWFDFSELCEGPRSQNDYIELARIFHAVLLSDVRQFTPANEDAARRFIALVDEFYDRSVKLIVSAEVPLHALYKGERLRFEFERTQSRLLEMQSREYLGRTHRA